MTWNGRVHYIISIAHAHTRTRTHTRNTRIPIWTYFHRHTYTICPFLSVTSNPATNPQSWSTCSFNSITKWLTGKHLIWEKTWSRKFQRRKEIALDETLNFVGVSEHEAVTFSNKSPRVCAPMKNTFFLKEKLLHWTNVSLQRIFSKKKRFQIWQNVFET